jgi:hypothetical protein
MIGDVLLVVLLPAVVFVAGARLMTVWTGREQVTARLERHAAVDERKPLNQRLGYDVAAVARHWGALDAESLERERRFLSLDLFFPLFYGAALAVSLLLGARLAFPAMNPAWLLAPVTIVVVSDWIENLVQLGQLRRFVEGGAAALQASSIAIASMATIVKLTSFTAASLLCVALAVAMLVRPAR